MQESAHAPEGPGLASSREAHRKLPSTQNSRFEWIGSVDAYELIRSTAIMFACAAKHMPVAILADNYP